MKVLVILACVSLAFAWPTRRDGGRGGGHGGGRGDGEQAAGDFMDQLPEGGPIRGEEIINFLDEGAQMVGKAKGFVQDLKDKADSATADDLETLGEDTRKMISDLEELDNNEVQKMGKDFFYGLMRLMAYGVESQGQCHKILEFLITEGEEAAKDGFGHDDWMKVVEAGREESGCILDRFEAYEEMIASARSDVQAAIDGADDGNHAMALEALMGKLFFGFSHLYRQVAVFAGTLHGLMEAEQQAGGQQRRAMNDLRDLLNQATKIQRALEENRTFNKYRI